MSVLKIIRKNFGTVGAVIVLGIIYFLTMSHNVTGYADSDELVLAAKLGGVAHPPSYPVYTLLLSFWLKLGWSNYIWAGSLLSGIMQLGTIVALGWVVKKIMPGINQMILSLGLVAVGLSNGFWTHAVVTEVFGLSNLLIMLTIGGFVAVYKKENWSKTQYLLLGIVWGLGLTHHPTYRAMMPLVIYTGWLIWNRDKNSKYLSGIGAVLGIFTYLGLWLLDGNKASYSWPIGNGLGGLWQTWNYQIYTSEGSAVEMLKEAWGLGNIWHSITSYAGLYYQEYGIAGIIFSAIGSWWLYRQDKKLFIGLIGTFGLLGLGIAVYMKFPDAQNISDAGYYWGTALRYRMLLSSFVINGMFWAFGITTLINEIKRIRYKLLMLGLIVIWVGMNGYGKFGDMNLSDANFTDYYTQTILGTLPQDSVLIVDDDLVFSLLYQQLVMGLRSDVAILPATWQMRHYWVDENQELIGHLYRNRQEQIIFGVANLLSQGKRVLVYGLDSQTYEQWGINGNPYFAVPNQYTIEIVVKPQVPITAYDYGITQQLTQLKNKRLSTWNKGLMGHVSLVHTFIGYLQSGWGNSQAGDMHLEIAQHLAQLDSNKQQIQDLRSGITKITPWNANLKLITPVEWQMLAKQSWAEGNYDLAKFQAQRAVMLESRNLVARQLLIEILSNTNSPSLADQVEIYQQQTQENLEL